MGRACSAGTPRGPQAASIDRPAGGGDLTPRSRSTSRCDDRPRRPVATYVFKVLIAIKSRNALVVSPHRRALGISSRIDDLVRQVLQAHGAPVDLVQCVRERTSRVKTEQFMTHDRVALILATGGSS